MTPEEMVARLLYRDGLMLVIDKPAGLPVHRGPKGAATKAAGIQGALQDHFDALRFGLPRPPELAHRLDRETAGCLVLGRHRKALATLGDLFKEARSRLIAAGRGGCQVEKEQSTAAEGRTTRGWWMKVDPKAISHDVEGMGVLLPFPSPLPCGRPHRQSEAKVVGRGSTTPLLEGYPPQPPRKGEGADRASVERNLKHFTWLALEPVTGRTHQLRVHCQAMGWPIVGDSIYGTAHRFGGPILHLLSREIVVPLYRNREPIRVAPVPPHMRAGQRGWRGERTRSFPRRRNQSQSARGRADPEAV
jgi:tRNA pseudouridine32 synthase/23S rRNA pseudouridine746 synthase